MRFDKTSILSRVLIICAILTLNVVVATPSQAASDKPLILTHYMPWFTAKPFSTEWGWHWTMNKYNPDHVVNGRRDAASKYRPQIGLYDSDDPNVLRCQVLLMKLAGIDGVMVDWYGNDNFNDFAINNRNTLAMEKVIAAARMKFAVCYEDSTVPKELAGGLIPAGGAVDHGKKLMQWMQAKLFSSPAYLKFNGRPVMLVFGQPYYSDTQWAQVFSVLPQRPLLLTEINNQDPNSAAGAFDWPLPGEGTADAIVKHENFDSKVPTYQISAACAFPRFDDFYAQAGVGKSWGHVDDQNGQTYIETLTNAIKSKPTFVQLVTWNDYGEGTQIEPTVENGYQDLTATQRIKRQMLDPTFGYDENDLRFAVEWFKLKEKYASNTSVSAKLDTIYDLAIGGEVKHAEAQIKKFK